jgi:hypothetical protein
MERFAEYSDHEIEQILTDRDSNTKNVIKVAEKLLIQYVETKYGSPVRDFFQDKSKIETSEILKKYYCEIRKKNGDMYARSTVISIRFELQRLFLQWHKWDIINDCEFKSANDIFGACLVKIKKEGNQTEHKPL